MNEKSVSSSRLPAVIEFNRPKKYKAIKRLGSGACGETVHVFYEEIECDFVAKKFAPIISRQDDPSLFQELMSRFKREAKILFRLSHPGIVRVYNLFDYPEIDTAFILMKMIDDKNIIDYLALNPTHLDRLLKEAVEAFSHLEVKEILHRDIRPDNILVDANGTLKVIDFGFGKDLTQHANSGGKSIYLNWWCQVPEDFDDGIYDVTTEVYFVGMLFRKIIKDGNLTDSRHTSLVNKMSRFERATRPQSFAEVSREISSGPKQNIEFGDHDLQVYRDFSSQLEYVVASIEEGAAYNLEPEAILSDLNALYETTMLETDIPNPSDLARIFILGTYRFYPKNEFPTSLLKDFIDLFSTASGQKRAIILSNISSKLDAIRRVSPPGLGDEIPF
jgi:serine/threonine protein kinase